MAFANCFAKAISVTRRKSCANYFSFFVTGHTAFEAMALRMTLNEMSLSEARFARAYLVWVTSPTHLPLLP